MEFHKTTTALIISSSVAVAARKYLKEKLEGQDVDVTALYPSGSYTTPTHYLVQTQFDSIYERIRIEAVSDKHNVMIVDWKYGQDPAKLRRILSNLNLAEKP